MTRIFKWPAAAGVLLIVAALVAWAVTQRLAGEREEGERAKKRGSAETPAQVSTEHGRTVLTIQPDTQARMGLEVAALKAAENREQMRATALVLSPQDLADLRSAYLTAEANAAKAQADLEVSSNEFNRLKLLHQEDQNASLKALQVAEGTMRSNQADANAAAQQLRLQSAVIEQRWGGVVAKWLAGRSPAFERVIEQKDWLVQVTLLAGSSLAAKRISLQLSDGSMVEANLVSAYPRIDPRIQGASFLYLVPARPGLAAGLNLLAQVPLGDVLHGVIVPETAVVWWQGQAWVYEQIGSEKFARQPAPTDMRVPGGWFVTAGLSPDQKVVVRGAQALLSQEFSYQTSEPGEKEEGEK